MALRDPKTKVWITPENKVKYRFNTPIGIGARKMPVQPAVVPATKLTSMVETLPNAHWMRPKTTQPEIELPKIRMVVERIGAHMVTKLIGRNTANGSMYLWKYEKC